MLKKILSSNFQNKMSKLAIAGALLSTLSSSPIFATDQNNDDLISKQTPFILKKIFSYLEIKDLGKVAQVSKHFKKVSEDNAIWKDIIPNQNINTKEDCRVFNFGFQILEKDVDYCGKKSRGVELFYKGEKQFKGICGVDQIKGGTMSLVSTPTYNILIISDQDDHEIIYFNSPESTDLTVNNIIYRYQTKK